MSSIYWLHLPEYTDYFTQGYIGVSQDHDERFYQHQIKLKNNYHENIHLQRAYKKYGEFQKDIILLGPDEYCYEIEEKLRPSQAIGWNINKGGIKPPRVNHTGIKRSEESKAKMRLVKLGKKRPPFTEETKTKMKANHVGTRGHKFSNEYKEKKRLESLNRKRNQYGRFE